MNNVKQQIQGFNLFQYLRGIDIKFDVSKEGAEYVLECPKCFRKKLSVCNTGDKKGLFNCYRCGFKGNLFDLISELEEITKNAAFKKIIQSRVLETRGNNALLDLLLTEQPDIKLPEPEIVKAPAYFLDLFTIPKNHAVWQYIYKRGLTEKQAKRWNLQYSTNDQRLIFPVYYDLKLVGWQGRDITGRSDQDKKYPKALTGPTLPGGTGFKKSWHLFGWDFVKKAKFVTIVEGPIDAIKGECVNSIALLGKTISDVQFKRLLTLKFVKTVFVALDPDAIEQSEKLIRQLRPFYDKVYLVNLPNKDFGESTESEIKEYLYKSSLYQPKFMLNIRGKI